MDYSINDYEARVMELQLAVDIAEQRMKEQTVTGAAEIAAAKKGTKRVTRARVGADWKAFFDAWVAARKALQAYENLHFVRLCEIGKQMGGTGEIYAALGVFPY